MRLPFEGKYERARNLQKEQRAARVSGRDEELVPADVMEKGDGLALLLAALVTIVPVCLAVLAVLAAIGYFFIV